jgi:POT family proton-dependent oligopeptide transporter
VKESKVVALKNGKSAMVSRELTIRVIFNANYWYVFQSSLPRQGHADRCSNRMINLRGLCGIITTNVERYAYAGFGFAFLICLCLAVTSGAIFLAGYTKFGE